MVWPRPFLTPWWGELHERGVAGAAPKAPPQTRAFLPGIVDYMIEQSGPPSKEVPTLKQVQEFLKDGDDVVIIGVFQGESDPAYQQYQDAGKYWPAVLNRGHAPFQEFGAARVFCTKLEGHHIGEAGWLTRVASVGMSLPPGAGAGAGLVPCGLPCTWMWITHYVGGTSCAITPWPVSRGEGTVTFIQVSAFPSPTPSVGGKALTIKSASDLGSRPGSATY